MYVLRLNTARVGNLNATSRYLESKEDDRLQIAIVALSFLSTDNVALSLFQLPHEEGGEKRISDVNHQIELRHSLKSSVES